MVRDRLIPLLLQALQCLSSLLDRLARVDTSLALGVARLASPAHLLLASEGKVHQHTFTPTKPAGRQWAKQPSENKVGADFTCLVSS